jgi:predicted Zn-dependent peptidase
MTLGVVGGYGDEERVLEIIKKEFAPLINDSKKMPEKNVFSWDEQKEPRTKLVSRKAEQAAVVMAFRGIDMNDERRYALELINIILGDGWTSRLMREVREERGWAYAVGSDIGMFTDAGEVMIGAGLPKNKLKEAVGLITEIAYGLAVPGKWQIKAEEVEMAKECFRGRFALAFDKPEEVLGSALDDITFRGKMTTPQEILEKIEKVKLEEVLSLAQELFKKEYLSIAVVGDYKTLPF